MDTLAVIFEAPERLGMGRLDLVPQPEDDLVVAVEWSGISTGTERLFYKGQMPAFPGLGYPLVPGYESVGRVIAAAAGAQHRVGTRVFVPGARCFGKVRGLFGGAARRIAVASDRVIALDETVFSGEEAVLLALAATARHALMAPCGAAPCGAAPCGAAPRDSALNPMSLPDLIIGHGVLGRLLARVAMACGGEAPTVWERNPGRRTDVTSYRVIDPAMDKRRDYRSIYDASGDAAILDSLVQHLKPGGEIVLAGFYAAPLSLTFPPAFMREARFRVAAEWQKPDLVATLDLVRTGRLALDGLITHRRPAEGASEAYRTAFADPACLKMILDWRTCP